MKRTVIGNLELVFGRKAVFFMGYECLGTGNVEKNGKIVDFPGEKSRGIFQVAAVFFGILMEKISRVQAAGRKMLGRRLAWYAAAGADWSCRTGYGSVRNAVDAGAGTSAGASALVAIDGRARRKRWGHARRGCKIVTDKVAVGNNPRDGNVCLEHLNADKHYIYKYISSGM